MPFIFIRLSYVRYAKAILHFIRKNHIIRLVWIKSYLIFHLYGNNFIKNTVICIKGGPTCLISKSKDNVFFELFSKGADIFNNSAKELDLLMNELDNPHARLDKLVKLEHEGDTITHELIEYTKKMFITPLDREDIFNITKGIDNITDCIESTAHLFYMYNLTSATPESIELIDKLMAVTSDLVVVISELKYLSKSTLITKKIIDVNTLENEADLIYRKAMRTLFENPEDLLFVIKWKNIYHHLEDSIDACETLANEIRGVAMKYA